jgi:hypothetical protein
MDISTIEGQELLSVEFAATYLRLRFDGPVLTFYAFPHLLFEAFSIANGEPEYRNGLCAQIGEEVEKVLFDEGNSLTVELVSGAVIAASLREEEREGPIAGAFSESGDGSDEEEF